MKTNLKLFLKNFLFILKMNNISLDEIPSYLKHSEVYKTLVEQKVKFISDRSFGLPSKNIPLYKPNSYKLTHKGCVELLKTIYFWKVEPSFYPNEFYVYISHYVRQSLNNKIICYLKKYNNEISKRLLPYNLNYMFLADVIESNNNLNLLQFVIDNDIKTIESIFNLICDFVKNDLYVVKFMLNKFDKNILKINDAFNKAIQNNNLNLAKLLLEYG